MVGLGSVIVEVGGCAHGASLHFIIKIKRKQEWGRRGAGEYKLPSGRADEGEMHLIVRYREEPTRD